MKFSELKELFHKKLDIDHLADIARELEVSPQAVSNWKSRDRVPYKYVVKMRRKFDNIPSLLEITPKQSKTNNEITAPKQENFTYMNYESDKISISDIFLILAKHLKLIIFLPCIFCLVTIIYVLFIAAPVYESTTKIMSSTSRSNTQTNNIAAQLGINLLTSDSETQWVYPEIIKSRTLAKSLLKRKFDTINFGPQKSLLHILTNGNYSKSNDRDMIVKGAVNTVISMISVQQNGSFYDLKISSPEALFSRDLATALIEELEDFQRIYNKQKTSKTRKFIENRINDIQSELEAAEEALKDFNNRNRRIENSPALQLERQRLSREVSVLIGVFTTLKQQLETTKIEEVKDSDYVLVLDKPEAPLYRSKPNRRQMVIISGVLGIFIGLIIAFIKEYFDNYEDEEQEKINKAKIIITKNMRSFFPKYSNSIKNNS